LLKKTKSLLQTTIKFQVQSTDIFLISSFFFFLSPKNGGTRKAVRYVLKFSGMKRNVLLEGIRSSVNVHCGIL
jgi:hypothetical protein